MNHVSAGTNMLTLQSFAQCLTDPKYPQDLNGTVDTKQLWTDWGSVIAQAETVDPDLTDVSNDKVLGKACPTLRFGYRGTKYTIADTGDGDILIICNSHTHLQGLCVALVIEFDEDSVNIDLPAQYLGEIFTAIEHLG